MSRYAALFDQFKRERLKIVPDLDLREVRWSSVPGLVSVVLPVYNGQDHVQEAADSILSQTYSEWELIAVDDGSTDRTPEILDDYSRRDARIRVIHQQNQKLPGALTRGFQQAQGEFLTWTSHDNRLYPDFLERMVDCLNRHPGWDFIYANLDIIGESGQPILDSDWYRGYQSPLGSQHIHLPKDPSELNTRPDNILGAALFYRQRVAGLLGDYSSYRYTVEDYDYWMRVNGLLNLKHADFSQPVYAYRFHSQSLTSQERALNISRNRDRLMVFDDFRRDFYLSPLIWWIDESVEPSVQAVASSLRKQVAQYCHVVYRLGDHDLHELPGWWVPVVYLHITDRVEDGFRFPDELPASALKALVVVGSDNPLPEHGLTDWDICVTTNPVQVLPRLKKPYQGWVYMPDVRGLYTSLDIKTRSHHLAVIEARLHEPFSADFKVSVIISTFRRAGRLEAAVASVAQQSFPPQDYEVVVVNNDPADTKIKQRVEALRRQYFNTHPERLRLVLCPLSGLSHARNAGIAAARGQVLCFMDDDAVAQPTWLEQIWGAFEDHPEAGGLGGSILLKKPDPLPKWWKEEWESYWGSFKPPSTVFYWANGWQEYPFGGNWSARRQALLEVGGFRTRYGRRGRAVNGGEEIVAAALLQRLGYRIGVVPGACVLHDVEPERYNLRQLWQNLISGRRAWYLAQQDLYLPCQLGVWQALRRIFKAIWPLSLRSLLKGPYIIGMEWLVFCWSVIDFLKRFRRPVGLRS